MSSAESENPTILFVPGAWHLPESFDAVRSLLRERGYPSIAAGLPSIGAEPPTKTLADDAALVRAEIKRLADAGKQVVVVTHSYGGLVGQNAVEDVRDLGYAQRKEAGKKGGVIMFVYMTAFVAEKGVSLLDMLGGKYLPWMAVNDDYCHANDAADTFYNDLPADEQQKWVSKLTHTSRAVFEGASSYEPWHDLPCMYILCDKDHAIPIALQEKMASLLGNDRLSFRCDASHSPFLSMPDKVADACELAAKAGGEKSCASTLLP